MPSINTSAEHHRNGHSFIGFRLGLRKWTLAAIMATVSIVPSASAAPADLTVYSYFESSWGPGKAIETGFEAICDCNLVWRSFDDAGTLLARLQLEGTNPQGDVVLGLDQNLLPDALLLDIWQEHKLDPAIVSSIDALPFAWHDQISSDTFLPYDFGWFAFVYKRTLGSNPPSSLDELAASDLTVIIQDPRSSSPGLGLVTWVKRVFGNDAADYWMRLKPRIVTVTPGWSESYNLFLGNEADLVLSYTSSPAYHRIAENDASYDWLSFTDGHYPQIEIMAITKRAHNPELARTFLKYILSDDVQRTLNTTNWMFPVRNVSLPDGFRNRSDPPSLSLFPADKISSQRRSWIDEWRNALTR